MYENPWTRGLFVARLGLREERWWADSWSPRVAEEGAGEDGKDYYHNERVGRPPGLTKDWLAQGESEDGERDGCHPEVVVILLEKGPAVVRKWLLETCHDSDSDAEQSAPEEMIQEDLGECRICHCARREQYSVMRVGVRGVQSAAEGLARDGS